MGETATSDAAPPQHLRALEQANRVRLARAELKRRVATQTTTVAEVVLDCPKEAEGMELSDLLMSQRRWGRARCRRVLLSLGLSENKQIGTLTERQRRLLALALMDRDPRPVATQRPPTHPLPPTDTEPRFHRAEALVGV